ncbi:MAG: NAD-dependent epimerase/dehydratase family protein [Caulobacterales bacterium]
MSPTARTRKTALVIGATGSFGAHAAQALIKHGWTVRALARNPEAAARQSGPRTPIEWVKGDAMVAAQVLAAARGADLIIHAANPAGYHNWKGLVVPMLQNALEAAMAVDARLVLPGNVYNFAPDSGPAIAEGAPQAPATRKGALRVEMERRLRSACERGARVLILRAGDFFGPAAPNSSLAWLTTRRGSRLTGIRRAGPADVGHAFAYLPDLAETLARLVDAEDRLGRFEDFHFRGHWLQGENDMACAIRRASGRADVPIGDFPWAVVLALSPVVEMFRELWEMRYLWRRPIGLDNARLTAFLGAEPHTPIDAALRATLSDMGVLEETPAARPPQIHQLPRAA